MTKDEILQLSKECVTENISASRLITSKPCFIFGVNIIPTTPSTVAILYLRNGELVTSDILIGFKGVDGMLTYAPILPVYFNKGLYLELNSNVGQSSVQYLLSH